MYAFVFRIFYPNSPEYNRQLKFYTGYVGDNVVVRV